VEAVAEARKADTSTQWVIHRPGKRECIWQETLELAGVGSESNPARRVYRLTERTIDKHGVVLLLPEYVLEGWTTTLPARFSATGIIALYCDHATHEQFGKTPSQHSEFKTDMDLERLPSGKFDTNYLACQLAALAMNLLRLIGQHTLNGPDAPVRHAAKRRRIKTVMQEMMFKAGRMIKHAGRFLRNLKTTMGMDILSCQTPQMNENQLWVHLLAYNVIRLLMAQVAANASVNPRNLSFKHAVQLCTK